MEGSLPYTHNTNIYTGTSECKLRNIKKSAYILNPIYKVTKQQKILLQSKHLLYTHYFMASCDTQCFSKKKGVLCSTPVPSYIMNSGSKREKHILYSNLFMVSEGPLSTEETPPPTTTTLLIDMWNPSLSTALKAVPVCVWKVLIVE